MRKSLQDFVPAPVDHISFAFDRPMDRESVATADDIVDFNGPSGAISATSFSWTDSRTLQVNFGSQTVLGSYEMLLGQNIRDIGDNLLDQSHNGVGGHALRSPITASSSCAMRQRRIS